MTRKLPSAALMESAMVLAEFGAKALFATEQLDVNRKPLDNLPLSDAERAIAIKLPDLSSTLKKKLETKTATFTLADAASILIGLAASFLESRAVDRHKLLVTAQKLTDVLQANLLPPRTKTKKSKSSKVAFQFKITLYAITPPIWRLIQVKDCTLDKLHEHIQTAMGWTNSHLHRFEIEGEQYGDPALLGNGVEDQDYVDSTQTLLSDLLPLTVKRFAFNYEYDFGDSWEHEILLEGHPPVDPKLDYPICFEGARACPPENCGGVPGYGNFLEVIRNPKHEEHESMLDWIGGHFDSEDFDAKRTTKAMKKGLPNWRKKT